MIFLEAIFDGSGSRRRSRIREVINGAPLVIWVLDSINFVLTIFLASPWFGIAPIHNFYMALMMLVTIAVITAIAVILEIKFDTRDYTIGVIISKIVYGIFIVICVVYLMWLIINTILKCI